MKRTAIPLSLSIAAVAGVAILLIAFVNWSPISEAFGPMSQDESQCMICSRERVRKRVCGTEVRNEVIENEHSEWIDSFTPKDHKHLWSGHTHYSRHNWFGKTSIGCGGNPVLSMIFAQRSSLGESAAQRLAVRFQNMVRGGWPQLDRQDLQRFEKALVDNPSSLLEGDDDN